MKEFVKSLTLFIVFCAAFSACNGTKAGNDNSVNTGSNKNSQMSEGKSSVDDSGSASKSSEYPPVVSGIAEGVIHLLDGSKTKLSDHKGKVVILNLWGIWCGPCRDEMPHLAAMQKQYGEKGLEVFGLNVGDHDGNAEPVENIKRFAEQSKIDYTLARIEAPMINSFYLFSKQQVVPQTLLVDREGHVRGLFVGGGGRVVSQLQQVLDKTMAE